MTIRIRSHNTVVYIRTVYFWDQFKNNNRLYHVKCSILIGKIMSINNFIAYIYIFSIVVPHSWYR